MKKTKKFYWSENTLTHFRFESNYISKSEIKKNIETFIELECTIEGGETEEELSEDLFNQVYNY
jgi:hypothetical protein